MSSDPVLRLIALHSADFQDAEDILFPAGKHRSDNVDPIEDAVLAFFDIIEEGLCTGADEVRVDLQLAEFVAQALKQRKQGQGRPFLTKRQSLLREATITFAERRVEELLREGLRIGAARHQAAEETAARAGRSGDHIAASTLVKLLKENATRRKARRLKV